MLYIVITEDYYGGNIGVFDNEEDARKHQISLSKTGVHTYILKANNLPFIKDKDAVDDESYISDEHITEEHVKDVNK